MDHLQRVLLCCVFSFLMKSVCCFNILVVFPEPTKSHGFLGHGYVRNLLKAHHKVTYITPFPWEDPPENLTQVDVSTNLNKSDDIFKELEETYKSKSMFLLMLAYSFGRLTLDHSNVKALLEDPSNKFDVVVAEWIDSEIYAGFAALYNCPLVWSISTQMYWQPMRLLDEYPNPAYSPDVNSGYTPPFTFCQRAKELWIQLEKSWILRYTIKSLEEEIYEEYFQKVALGNRFVPSFEDIPKSYAFMLINNHPSIGSVWRLPPNARDIGGYHIVTPPKPLPMDLQILMDNSTGGVVYFSMGTTVCTKCISDKMLKELLNVFKNLNKTVIWKMEKEIEELPENVYLLNWAPQTSLLAHPNMKLFITHGGQLSVTEAIHFGVPLIAIPRHADQFTNADALVKKGVAMKLNFDDDLPSNLESALKTMLNITYSERAKRLSEIYHDRLVPPGTELVYWIEHVVRNHGASYLHSPALLASWYQKAYIDLAALMITVTILTICIIFFSIRGCCKALKCY